MNILLINPLVRKWALPNCFPTGLGYMASAFTMAGHNVQVLDFNGDREFAPLAFHFYREKNIYSPDIIGIGGIVTQYKEIKGIVESCRQYWPNVPIICGGPIAGSISGLLLEKTEINVCVQGEGESQIENIICSSHAINKITIGPEEPIDISRQFLPWPSYSLFPMEEYIRNPIGPYNPNKWIDGKPQGDVPKSMNMIATRGCLYNCLHGNSLIDTAEFGKKQIKDLVGKTPKVLTRDPKTRKVVYARASKIWKTRKDAELVRIHFTDGTYIDCTPDHRFIALQYKNQFQLRKEWEVEGQDLKTGQSVVACKYPGQLIAPRVMMERILGRKLKKGECIHHIDRNKKNNSPDNLMLFKSHKEHISFHPELSDRMKEDNPVFKIPNFKKVLSDRAKKTFTGRSKSLEERERIRQAKLGEKNPNYGKKGKDSPLFGIKRSDEVKLKISKKMKGRIIDGEWRKKISEGNLGKKRTEEQKNNYRLASKKRKTKRVEIANHKVSYIEKLPEREDVYCMEVPGYDWFFANDILVHNCLFCYHNFQGQGYRKRSYNDVIMEMDFLGFQYEIEYIHFTDDAFAVDKKWVKDFCCAFKGRKMKWSCTGRANALDEDLVSTMADSGCIGIWVGLESGSDEILKRMDKKVTVEKYREVVPLLRKYFKYEDYTFIVGSLGETTRTVTQSIDFCKEMGITPSAIFYMTPYPGTPLFNLLMNDNRNFRRMVNDIDGQWGYEKWIESLGEQGKHIAWDCSGAGEERLKEWKEKFFNETKKV